MSRLHMNHVVLMTVTLLAGRPVFAADGATPANAPPANSQTLARQILADQDLPQVLDKAKALLKTGLTAGSGYGEVWIRDLNTFIELSLQVNAPESIHEALFIIGRGLGQLLTRSAIHE